MSIRLRLLILISFIIVVVLVLVVVAGTQVSRFSSLTESITSRSMSRVEYVSQINTNLMRWRGLNLSIIVTEEPRARKEYQQQLSEVLADTESFIQPYGDIMTDPVRRADYEAFLKHIDNYLKVNYDLEYFVAQGKTGEAQAVFANSQEPFDEMMFHISRLRNDEINIAREASLRATVSAENTRNFFTWATIGGIAVLIGLGFYIWYSFTSGLRRLLAATRHVTSGDLSQPRVKVSRDEFGELIQSFNTMIASLKQSQEENRQLTQEALHLQEERIRLLQQQFSSVIKAQEEERKRIARELHDDTAQTLVILSRSVDSLISRQKQLPESLEMGLEELRQMVNACLQNIRRFSQDLRPSIIDDLGLVPSIEWLAERLEKLSSVKANIQVEGSPQRLAPDIELTLFRIVQEALNNVAKHSQASQVSINVSFTADKVALSITDNGKGFTIPVSWNDVAARGQLGLLGMMERAQLLRGNLQINSQPGKGATISVGVPLVKA